MNKSKGKAVNGPESLRLGTYLTQSSYFITFAKNMKALDQLLQREWKVLPSCNVTNAYFGT